MIPKAELKVRFSRSSGPGGQNVNRRETKVELEFDLLRSSALSDAQKERVRSRLGLADGEMLRVVVQSTRSQSANREIAEERLASLLRKGLRPVRQRRATTPTRASKESRLLGKKRRGELKRSRREME
jgi:ribosome-associated protein